MALLGHRMHLDWTASVYRSQAVARTKRPGNRKAPTAPAGHEQDIIFNELAFALVTRVIADPERLSKSQCRLVR
jgi:hypothetical protein